MATTKKRGTRKPPRCVIIAGPNGAGKTTFAREFLVKSARIDHFINADLIASGLAPLNPSLAGVAAARLMLAEINRLSRAQENFAFESTLSGRAYPLGYASGRRGGIESRSCFSN
jgi:predicted ABC-type ATPase